MLSQNRGFYAGEANLDNVLRRRVLGRVDPHLADGDPHFLDGKLLVTLIWKICFDPFISLNEPVFREIILPAVTLRQSS